MPHNLEVPAVTAPHKITLDGRSRLAVTGVTDVESFDETMVVLKTTRGVLLVSGTDLHLLNLNLDGGQVSVDGTVDALTYEDDVKKGGFFSRLWG